MTASRRSFLRGAGLIGAGVAALGTVSAAPSAAAGRHPDPDAPRFTLVVMPDTQYLFDEDRGDAAPLDASLRYALDGGSAMIRLYRFDLARKVVDRSTLSPWLLARNSARLGELDRKNGLHAWCGIFSRLCRGRDTGKTGGDPLEPAATLALSDGAPFEWAVFPLNQNGISTCWGHELPLDQWWHVALVNDGRRTTMFVEGCPVLRNPRTSAVGIAGAGNWLLGACDYDRTVDQGFYGWIGDVRIVGRALTAPEFMLR